MGCSKIRHVLGKLRLILDEMCRLYGKFASYLRRVLCKTRLIFPRINGPTVLLMLNLELPINSISEKRIWEAYRGCPLLVGWINLEHSQGAKLIKKTTTEHFRPSFKLVPHIIHHYLGNLGQVNFFDLLT